ncbi:hypothetical protein HDV57DRAFT_259387 [Trichoderma longibrachiatum]|uniref:Uncharacterized protein n=1 Tax=Trichoderma longibrachiatum ATCC 18648 TaxID=983965 RepID=A0A2T4BTW3_TRILO|nr:hypothetical protein M440DRAFT_1079809 [Trichoderma longibrachiatum ATCC 18648]
MPRCASFRTSAAQHSKAKHSTAQLLASSLRVHGSVSARIHRHHRSSPLPSLQSSDSNQTDEQANNSQPAKRKKRETKSPAPYRQPRCYARLAKESPVGKSRWRRDCFSLFDRRWWWL